MHNMTYGELIEHARRLHVLASSRAGTHNDLVQLRDLVPRLIEAVRELSEDDQDEKGSTPPGDPG